MLEGLLMKPDSLDTGWSESLLVTSCEGARGATGQSYCDCYRILNVIYIAC